MAVIIIVPIVLSRWHVVAVAVVQWRKWSSRLARWLLPEAEVTALTPGVCARAAERFEALSGPERERCRRIEHNRWVLFHALHGWRYAPTRDNAAREHPLMVPYEALDEAERLKDDNAWLLLGTLAKDNKL